MNWEHDVLTIDKMKDMIFEATHGRKKVPFWDDPCQGVRLKAPHFISLEFLVDGKWVDPPSILDMTCI